ncbi:MAG: hypothetical protein RMJ67_01410 [Elusimicrobiota bacterium]|nr:hypothetical protein [Endomicrobiia bacterium]MDW8165162.1 hypothetical protein [Elusimicrobiota bacterium]
MIRKYGRYKISIVASFLDKRMHKLFSILEYNHTLCFGVRDLGNIINLNDSISLVLSRLRAEGYADYFRYKKRKVYYLTNKGIDVYKRYSEVFNLFNKEISYE